MKQTKWMLVIVGVLLLTACVFSPLPLQFVFLLVAGWVIYLGNTLPNVTVNWADVAVGLSALACTVLFVHWFCSWLARERARAVANVAPLAQKPPPIWRWRWSALLVALVVLMFAAGTGMIGLVHQTSWLLTMENRKLFDSGNREAARRNGSLNNARQLVMAAAGHESSAHKYPAGCTTDAQGRLLHGWMTSLLPYLEEVPLYKKIDRQQAWDSSANEQHFRARVGIFQSPGAEEYEDDRGFPVAHYSSNVYVIGGDERRELKDIHDGISQTLLIGEAVSRSKAWGSPTNWRDPTLGLRTSPDGFGGPWNGQVTIMAFADGHAQAIPSDIDPRVLRAIATPAGGEAFDPEDLE